jgi:ketosteroid isomerase-like protein
MSRAQNIDVVREMFEAHLAAAPERALQLFHPEVEYDTTLRPDGKVWHGRDGVRGAIAEWTATWDEYEMEVERYLEAGEERVAVLWHERGRAKASGVPLALSGITVCTVKDGLIVAMRVELDREGTLRALGL